MIFTLLPVMIINGGDLSSRDIGVPYSHYSLKLRLTIKQIECQGRDRGCERVTSIKPLSEALRFAAKRERILSAFACRVNYLFFLLSEGWNFIGLSRLSITLLRQRRLGWQSSGQSSGAMISYALS